MTPLSLCRALRLALLIQAFGGTVQATHSFLSEPLVRKGQVQDVLEHHPAKVPCKNSSVRRLRLSLNVHS